MGCLDIQEIFEENRLLKNTKKRKKDPVNMPTNVTHDGCTRDNAIKQVNTQTRAHVIEHLSRTPTHHTT